MEILDVPSRPKTLSQLYGTYARERRGAASAGNCKSSTVVSELATMRSALRHAARAVGRERPDQIPIELCGDIPAMTSTHLRSIGAKKRLRWNVTNLLSRLAKWSRDVDLLPPAPEDDLSPAWRIVDQHARETFTNSSYIRRLARFCTRIAADPTDVTPEVSRSFYAYISSAASGIGGARGYYLTIERHWKKLVEAGVIPENATVHSEARTDTRAYRLRFAEWPPKLSKEEAERRTWTTKPHAVRRSARCKQNEVSASNTRVCLERLVGFVVSELGCDISDFGLSDLIREDIVVAHMNWLSARLGATTGSHKQVLMMLLSIGRNFLSRYKGESVDVSWLEEMLQNIDPETRKNKCARLVPRRELDKVLDHILARIKYLRAKKASATRIALAVRDFVLLAVLFNRAPRNRNVREATVQRDPDRSVTEEELTWVNLYRDPRTSNWMLLFREKEVKYGKIRLEYSFPPEHVGLLEDYLSVHRRRLLGDQESDVLFVSKTGRPLRTNSIHAICTKWCEKAINRKINPHLVRDIITDAVYPTNPTAARDLLGHTTVKTTERIYNSRQSGRAAEILDELRHTGTVTRVDEESPERMAVTLDLSADQPKPEELESVLSRVHAWTARHWKR